MATADKELARRLFGPHDPNGRLLPNTVNMLALKVLVGRLLRRAQADFIKLLERCVIRCSSAGWIADSSARGERRSSDENKAAMLRYLAKYRTYFAHLAAIVRWSQQAQAILAVQSIIARLQKDDNIFEQTCQNLDSLSQQLALARSRNYDVLTAIDVLSTGTMSLLPKVVRQSLAKPLPLTQTDIDNSLIQLDEVIRRRLLFQECGVPRELLQNWSVDNGRLRFRVEHEFEVTLTLPAGPDPEGPWEILDLDILTNNSNSDPSETISKNSLPVTAAMNLYQSHNLKLLARDILYPRNISSNQQLPTSTTDVIHTTPALRLSLMELYHFLHHFALSLRLEHIYHGLERLARTDWKSLLKVQRDDSKRAVIVKYWPHTVQRRDNTTNDISKSSLPPAMTISIQQSTLTRSIELSRLGNNSRPPDPESSPMKVSVLKTESVDRTEYYVKESRFSVTLPFEHVQNHFHNDDTNSTLLDPLRLKPYQLFLNVLRLHVGMFLREMRRLLLFPRSEDTLETIDVSLSSTLPFILPFDVTQIELQETPEQTLTVAPHHLCRLNISMQMQTGIFSINSNAMTLSTTPDLLGITSDSVIAVALPELLQVAQDLLNRDLRDVLHIINSYRISSFLEILSRSATYHGFRIPVAPLWIQNAENVFGISKHVLYLRLCDFETHYLVINIVNGSLAAWLAEIRALPISTSSQETHSILHVAQINLQHLLNLFMERSLIQFSLASVEQMFHENETLATLRVLCRDYIALSMIRRSLDHRHIRFEIIPVVPTKQHMPTSLFTDALDKAVLRIRLPYVTDKAIGLASVLGSVYAYIQTPAHSQKPEVCFTTAVNIDSLPHLADSILAELPTPPTLGTSNGFTAVSTSQFEFNHQKSRITLRYKTSDETWERFCRDFSQICVLIRLAKCVGRVEQAHMCNGYTPTVVSNGFRTPKRRLSVIHFDFLSLDFRYGRNRGLRLHMGGRANVAAGMAALARTSTDGLADSTTSLVLDVYTTSLLRTISVPAFVDYLLVTQQSLLCLHRITQTLAASKIVRQWPLRLLYRSASHIRILYLPAFGIDIKFVCDRRLIVLSDAGWSPFDSPFNTIDANGNGESNSNDRAQTPIAYKLIPMFEDLLNSICELGKSVPERRRQSANLPVTNVITAIIPSMTFQASGSEDLLDMLNFGPPVPDLSKLVEQCYSMGNGKVGSTINDEDDSNAEGDDEEDSHDASDFMVLRLSKAVALSITLFPCALELLHRFMSGSAKLMMLETKAKAFPEFVNVITNVNSCTISFDCAGLLFEAKYDDDQGWTMRASQPESSSDAASNASNTDKLTHTDANVLSTFFTAKGLYYRNSMEYVEASMRFISLPVILLKDILSVLHHQSSSMDGNTRCDLHLMVPDERPFLFLPPAGELCVLFSKSNCTALLLFDIISGSEHKCLPLQYEWRRHELSIWPDQHDESLTHQTAMPEDTNLLITQLMQRSLRSRLERILQTVTTEAPLGLKLSWCIKKLLARPLSDLAL